MRGKMIFRRGLRFVLRVSEPPLLATTLGPGSSLSTCFLVKFHSSPAHFTSEAIKCTQPLLSPAQTTAPAGDSKEENEKVELPASEPVQKLHAEMMGVLAKKAFFPNTALYELFHACSNRTDIKLGLEVLDRLHKARASQLKQFENFNGDISGLVAGAFVRVKAARSALDVIKKYNTYGLSPHIKASHQLLEYATATCDAKLTRKILQNMLNNSIHPTADTANIILRQCIKRRHIGTLLLIAKEFHINGIKLYPSTYDICLASAANTGRIDMLMEIQKWREQYSVPNSTSSTFALAKAHVLKGKPHDAAKLIADECKDADVRKRYVGLMVRLWPVDLAMSHTGSKKSAKHSITKVKGNLIEMLKSLAELGCEMQIDVEKEYGTGKGKGDKYEYCFGTAEAQIPDAVDETRPEN